LEWLHKEAHPSPEDDEDWTLYKPEFSIAIYKMMVATDWRHLPYPGGLLDQPDWLLADLFTLAWRKNALKEMSKAPPRGAPKAMVFGR
jgi:hypothetical protein